MRVELDFFIPAWVMCLSGWTLGGFAAVSALAFIGDGAKIKHEAARYGYLLLGGPLLWVAFTYSWWGDTPKTHRFGRFLIYRVGGRWVRGPAWPVWIVADQLKVGTRRTGLLISLRRDGLHDAAEVADA